MERLGEILVIRGLITRGQRDRALTRQCQTRVGRMGTALLEDGIREDVILQGLSEQLRSPAAGGAELDDVRSDNLRLLSPKVACRLGAIPFRRVGRLLAVAMLDPRDLPAIDEIASLTGLTPKPHIALEARIAMALAKHYGMPVDPRYLPLLRRTDARKLESSDPASDLQGPSPSRPRSAGLRVLPPPPPDISVAYPIQSRFVQERGDPWETVERKAVAVAAVAVPSTEFFDDLLESLDPSVSHAVETLPEEAVALQPEAMQFQAPPTPDRGLGSRDEDALVLRLANAESRDQIAEALLTAALAEVRRAALFISQGDHIIGWSALPAPPEGLRSFQIPYSEPSVFATIQNTEGFYVGPYPDLDSTARVLRALGSDGLGSMAVVPMNLKGKTVLYLYGEAESNTRPPSVPALKRLAAKGATALEILLLKNRLRVL